MVNYNRTEGNQRTQERETPGRGRILPDAERKYACEGRWNSFIYKSIYQEVHSDEMSSAGSRYVERWEIYLKGREKAKFQEKCSKQYVILVRHRRAGNRGHEWNRIDRRTLVDQRPDRRNECKRDLQFEMQCIGEWSDIAEWVRALQAKLKRRGFQWTIPSSRTDHISEWGMWSVLFLLCSSEEKQCRTL